MRIKFSTKPDYAIGGGFTFVRNLVKYLERQGVSCVFEGDDYDIYFLIGPTTAQREDVKQVISQGKKIVLRVDNIPEDYRNRGTAVSRLKDFSEMADVVVYQSEWAKRYVMGLTGTDGVVIYNGVDKDIFKPGKKIKNTYLYIRSSTNESKRWQEAKYIYRQKWLKGEADMLTIVGNFADYTRMYGDDFFKRYKMGMFDEPYEYLGQIENPLEVAEILKTHEYLIAPFYNDACSNTILEARACGCKIIFGTAKGSGSNPELMRLYKYDLGIMGEQYLGIFKLLTNE
jgi:glycosyltransferase involved in cell wall biosynthesis